MTSGIIVILAALIPFLVEMISNKIKKDATPQEQLNKANERINEDIAKHNTTDINLFLDAELQNKVSGNKQ